MKNLFSILLIVTSAFFVNANTPCYTCDLIDAVQLEYVAPGENTSALTAFLSALIGVVEQEESNYQFVKNSEASASTKSNAGKYLNQLRKSKSKLKKLQQRSMGNIRNKADYRSILSNALKLAGASSEFDPGFIAIAPDGRPVQIIPLPPKNSCSGAGDRVEDDCMEAMETLEECGAISPADKVMGNLTCKMAGNSEQNKCNIQNSLGQEYIPAETNMAEEAMGACDQMENDRDLNGNPQKEMNN